MLRHAALSLMVATIAAPAVARLDRRDVAQRVRVGAPTSGQVESAPIADRFQAPAVPVGVPGARLLASDGWLSLYALPGGDPAVVRLSQASGDTKDVRLDGIERVESARFDQGTAILMATGIDGIGRRMRVDLRTAEVYRWPY